jgi:hypothetical protein
MSSGLPAILILKISGYQNHLKIEFCPKEGINHQAVLQIKPPDDGLDRR